ncbi:MAG: UbiD family decarboxylase [Desulfovibrio sp.]|uniref:UbiD family decarboxylase n=1 Tax=Desulfovibrio sp. 7SRBS1 TaxID=3378064 RepID=UPI003B3F1D43
MIYRNLSQCLTDLEATGQLVRITAPVDSRQEAGIIQRRAYRKGGPALLFTNVKGCSFPMAANLFGTMQRTRYIFRSTLRAVENIMALKADPMRALRAPWKYAGTPLALLHALPRRVKAGPVLANTTTLSQLPQLESWPNDGGAFITLPLVYSENPDKPGFAASNLGMYRVQISGNSYAQDKEAGLHYQIHRGIGDHHSRALARNEPLRVNVFVGGSPAMTLAAVMPLPEGIPELYFAGVLAGHRMEMIDQPGKLPMLAQADFCISGHVLPGNELPEGPFGDHFGYYSLQHDFPVLQVDAVYHRDGAVWPFTTVGRPPQEDTTFGDFIHELTAELVPTVFSGVHEVHAVDAAGVHPLLLAVGSERYVPYARERQPQELLTNAMGLLGNTQTSLTKYLFIGAREDCPALSAHDVSGFFRHMLERFDPERDLHFITRTTMDTLDYSGTGLNQGSKLIWAAAGDKKRNLAVTRPSALELPKGFSDPYLFVPGILVVQGPKHTSGPDRPDRRLQTLAKQLGESSCMDGLPLVVVADDSRFTASNWENFLWITFTRSDPATDVYGGNASTHCKHWGCSGPVIIDARLKAHQAPPLEPDPEAVARVEQMAIKGGPLHGII